MAQIETSRRVFNVVINPVSWQINPSMRGISEEEVKKRWMEADKLKKLMWTRVIAAGVLGTVALGLHAPSLIAAAPLLYTLGDGLIFIYRKQHLDTAMDRLEHTQMKKLADALVDNVERDK